jgi:hypothetical protein
LLSTEPRRADRRRALTASRAIAFVVAVLVLLVSLSAEAKKKKKAAKKQKTPAGKVTKSKSKSGDRGLPPGDMGSEPDEASKEKEEKTPSKPEPDEGEEKAAKTPAPTADEFAGEAPAPKPAKPPRKAPEPEPAATGGGPIALSLGVGGKALFRNLSWTDANGALAPYSLAPGPEAGVWLEAFPAAFATDGFAGNIGIYGHFDYGLGASSKTPPPANQTLTTKYMDFLAGVKVRIPLGNFLPYVAGGYGMQKFSLDPVAPERPNFNYSFASGGAGARIQITPALDLDLGAAFLYVLNPGSAAGEVKSMAFFPHTTGYGFDASLSIGFRLFGVVGLRAGGDFRQFGLTTNWKTGEMPKAGGAADRYITAWGGVEIVFDGMGGGPGGGGEEAAPPKSKTTAPAKARKPPAGEGETEDGDKEPSATPSKEPDADE